MTPAGSATRAKLMSELCVLFQLQVLQVKHSDIYFSHFIQDIAYTL